MESVTFVLCLLVMAAHSLLVFGVDCNIDGHKLKVGEKYAPIGNCLEYTCRGKNEYSALGCATADSRGCTVVEQDLSKPYPACCSYLKDCSRRTL